jgi:beta-galactosidase
MEKFPKNFYLGYSCSGFQFEQGLPGSEDPNSDWWLWVHDKENIIAGLVSGDFPENGPGYWHLYKLDHDIAEKLGMNTLRVGVEWSRIFPKPTFDIKVDYEVDEEGRIISIDIDDKILEKLDGKANHDAVKHYREMFNDWKSRGKTLIINLYHWSLPLWLHNPIKVRKYGVSINESGWLNKQTVIEFTKYAAYLVWKLDDLADLWSTMNEPNVVAEQGYMFVKSGFPPGYLSFEAAKQALLNLLEAHARAYDIMKKFTRKPIGIIYAYAWMETLEPGNTEIDREVRERFLYPFIDSLVFGKSRMTGERKDLGGRIDWIGVNYYSRVVYKYYKENDEFNAIPGYGFLCTPNGSARSGRPCSDFGWEIYPEGIYKLLKELWNRYKIDLIVTENGISDKTDKYRSYYLVSHLHAIYKALNEGASIKGYLHWSLTDNYEWAQGFRQKFGLVMVDMKTKKRYLRPSAYVFREIVLNNGIPDELTHLIDVDQL